MRLEPPQRRTRVQPMLFVLAACLGLPGGLAAQGDPAQHLLVLDRDAHQPSGGSGLTAGAVFNVDLADLPSADAPLEVAADGLAMDIFLDVSAVAISPADGRAYVADIGLDRGFDIDGSIHAVTGSLALGGSAMSVVSDFDSAGLSVDIIDPFDLAFTSDGQLIGVDWETDPSGLGADDVGGTGHGAVFSVGLNTGVLSLIADGRNHPTITAVPATESVFQDPVAVAYDEGLGVLYVADPGADPLASGFFTGAVFRVDIGSGEVSIASTDADLTFPTALAVLPDGSPLVVNGGSNSSTLVSLDVGAADTTTNGTVIASGAQFATLENVSVDRAGNIFVVDSGEYFDGAFLRDPAVLHVLQGGPPGSNATLVYSGSGSGVLVTPVALAAVNVPVVNAVSPDFVCRPIETTLTGVDLFPEMILDAEGSGSFSGPMFTGGVDLGTSLGVTVGVDASTYIVTDLTATHPFGGSSVLVDSLTIDGDGGPLPFSPIGDASADGVIDGVDLGILGRNYGKYACDDPADFNNDADFDNNNRIDGVDSSILMTFFGFSS